MSTGSLVHPDRAVERPGPAASTVLIELPRPAAPDPSRDAPSQTNLSQVGFVVIGRNEGERLIRALRAVVGRVPTVVYADSGSTDGSPDAARRLGATVVELDPAQPVTHARARNLGFDTITRLRPDLEFVHFLDGDCEIVDGWLDRAVALLRDRPDVVWVCGRVLELFPEKSLYNRLRALEWNWHEPGEVEGSAGNGLARVAAVRAVGAFNGDLIAGADWEICLRLRQRGGKIYRLDVDMCRHDSAMYSYRSWWNRNLRAGHVWAEGVYLHGRDPERYKVRQCASNFLWGLVTPLLALALAWPTAGWSLLLLLLHPLKILQVVWRARRRGFSHGDAWLFGLFTIVDKTPMAIGQLASFWRVLRRRRHTLIEYH